MLFLLSLICQGNQKEKPKEKGRWICYSVQENISYGLQACYYMNQYKMYCFMSIILYFALPAYNLHINRMLFGKIH